MEPLQINLPPPLVGWWIFPGGLPGCETKFGTVAIPSKWHRFWMKILLGFRWEKQ